MAAQKGRTVQPAGNTIRQLRLDRGLRVEDLAEKSGFSPRTIDRLEAGQACFLFTITKLATTLGVTPDTLLSDPDAEEQPAEMPNPIAIQIVARAPFDDLTEKLVSFIGSLRCITDQPCDLDVVNVTDAGITITVTMNAQELVMFACALTTLRQTMERMLTPKPPRTGPQDLMGLRGDGNIEPIMAAISILEVRLPDSLSLPAEYRNRVFVPSDSL